MPKDDEEYTGMRLKKKLNRDIMQLAEEVAAELNVSSLSQEDMVNMMYLDYMSRRKTRLKGKRNA